MKTESIVMYAAVVLAVMSCSKSGGSAAVRASGTIEATEVDVAAQVTGQVHELLVDEGSSVQAGETLALIDHLVPMASVSQAQANLVLAQANGRRTDTLFRSGSATRQQKDATDAQLSLAQAGLVLAQKTLDNCTVTSPVSGTVTSKAVEVGDLATPGAVIVSISKLDTVKLTIYVSETELPKVKLGAPAEVRIDAFPKQVFPGRVTFISPTAEFTPKNIQTREDRVKLVFAVRIEIPNPDGSLKPGLPADATVKIADRQ